MPRTITVKGVGRVSAKPDYVVLSLLLDTRDENYDKAMDLATQHLEELNKALTAIDFSEDALKTTNFNVRTDYRSEKDKHGGWHEVFNGYVVTHNLKLEFDFDMKRLSAALSAISGCVAHPQLSVAFTVKDPTDIKEELLRSAAKNAKHKAKVLCAAAEVELRSLLNIDYNWNEINICSPTKYMLAEDCDMALASKRSMDIRPDDITVNDTVTFVWEIA